MIASGEISMSAVRSVKNGLITTLTSNVTISMDIPDTTKVAVILNKSDSGSVHPRVNSITNRGVVIGSTNSSSWCSCHYTIIVFN